MSKNVVHILGNSHVSYFFKDRLLKTDEIAEKDYDKLNLHLKIYKIGGTGSTIFSLFNENSQTKTGTKIKEYLKNQKNTDYVALFLGEVDIREHMIRFINEDFNLFEQVNEKINLLMSVYENYILGIRYIINKKLFLIGSIPYSKEFIEVRSKNDNHNYVYINFIRDIFDHKLTQLCTKINATPILIENNDYRKFIKKNMQIFSNDKNDCHLNLENANNILVEKLYNSL